ncbi:MAG: hypothetical protein K8W52_34575 [Deltaproteobacteria bacterium]|nr:hypothetical protein [Deltaproteobacteria bacterium]
MTRRILAALLLSSLAACGAPRPGAQVPAPRPIAQPAPRPIAARLDRAQLKAALAARRKLSVARFLAYREARVYPENTYQPGPLHVWLDASGHLCAAATIISGDWGKDATARVATENNQLALADVHSGPLADWILTSGLTHHEIVAIQVPPMGDMPDMPEPQPTPREAEIARLYGMYVDVERQITGMWDENLDEATDALMKRPDLARALIGGVAAGPGRYATPTNVAIGFAQPPA